MSKPFAKLNELDKGKLPIMEELCFAPKDYKYHEPQPLRVGSVIVRPAYGYTTGKMKPFFVRFGKTPKGTYVFRAHRDRSNKYLKSIIAHTSYHIVGKPTIVGGMVCFINGKMPYDSGWTHFEVVKMAKNGRACFVEPRIGNLRAFYRYPSLVRRGPATKTLSKIVLMEMINAY